jgi:hypothetical protein
MDAEGVVLINVISNLAKKKKKKNPKINDQKFASLISYVVGVNAIGNSWNGLHGGWLDESTTALIVNNQGEINCMEELSFLYTVLFYYAHPSITINVATGTQIYEASNIQLAFNTFTSTYNFMFINKDSLLKYTDNRNYVATPLVLTARRQINI